MKNSVSSRIIFKKERTNSMILLIGRFLSKDFLFLLFLFLFRSLLFIFKLLLPQELSSFYLYLSPLCPRIISLYYLFHYFFHTEFLFEKFLRLHHPFHPQLFYLISSGSSLPLPFTLHSLSFIRSFIK